MHFEPTAFCLPNVTYQLKTASHLKNGSKTVDCLLEGADLFDECPYNLFNLVNVRTVMRCQLFADRLVCLQDSLGRLDH